MCFEIHLRIEDDKLLLQTFLIRAHEVVLPKVDLECVVVEVVLRLSSAISSVADVTAFVLVATMREQFIVTVETLSAETTLRVALETTLIYRARVVVSVLFVLA